MFYFIVLTNINILRLIELLVDRIFAVYGTPIRIVSDRGSLFTSNFWSNLYFYMKIRRKLSTAFYPQIDG